MPQLEPTKTLTAIPVGHAVIEFFRRTFGAKPQEPALYVGARALVSSGCTGRPAIFLQMVTALSGACMGCNYSCCSG
jgi:hypothetical protein